MKHSSWGIVLCLFVSLTAQAQPVDWFDPYKVVASLHNERTLLLSVSKPIFKTAQVNIPSVMWSLASAMSLADFVGIERNKLEDNILCGATPFVYVVDRSRVFERISQDGLRQYRFQIDNERSLLLHATRYEQDPVTRVFAESLHKRGFLVVSGHFLAKWLHPIHTLENWETSPDTSASFSVRFMPDDAFTIMKRDRHGEMQLPANVPCDGFSALFRPLLKQLTVLPERKFKKSSAVVYLRNLEWGSHTPLVFRLGSAGDQGRAFGFKELDGSFQVPKDSITYYHPDELHINYSKDHTQFLFTLDKDGRNIVFETDVQNLPLLHWAKASAISLDQPIGVRRIGAHTSLVVGGFMPGANQFLVDARHIELWVEVYGNGERVYEFWFRVGNNRLFKIHTTRNKNLATTHGFGLVLANLQASGGFLAFSGKDLTAKLAHWPMGTATSTWETLEDSVAVLPCPYSAIVPLDSKNAGDKIVFKKLESNKYRHKDSGIVFSSFSKQHIRHLETRRSQGAMIACCNAKDSQCVLMGPRSFMLAGEPQQVQVFVPPPLIPQNVIEPSVRPSAPPQLHPYTTLDIQRILLLSLGLNPHANTPIDYTTTDRLFPPCTQPEFLRETLEKHTGTSRALVPVLFQSAWIVISFTPDGQVVVYAPHLVDVVELEKTLKVKVDLQQPYVGETDYSCVVVVDLILHLLSVIDGGGVRVLTLTEVEAMQKRHTALLARQGLFLTSTYGN